MDIYHQFHGRIGDFLKQLAAGSAAAQYTVEAPRDPAHGDLSTNAALVISKQIGKPPREIADRIAEWLRAENDITKADVAGPGFVNWSLSPAFWQKTLRGLLSVGETYGRAPELPATPENTINVEYVSTNPTGPLHIGHGRGAVFGDALASLLQAAGHPVVREYYINDAGAQVDVLARSAYLRYREALGENIGTIPAGLYPGDYLKPVGAALAKKHGREFIDKPEAEWLPQVRAFSIAAMMELIREDLAGVGIRHDLFFSERKMVDEGKVSEAIDALRAKDLIYEGVLPPPKGGADEDWEPRQQTLFRATQFGDDVDRALLKSDGSFTYFATDIAYHYEKFKRGANSLIDVWGADGHGGYVKRMVAAVKAMTGGKGTLEVRLTQLVKILRHGEPVKMSKRAGDFVTLREVIDEVGPDPIRFMMLMRKNDAPLDFDLAKVVEQSKDNPVFYVQYAHARIHSVYRQAAQAFPGLKSNFLSPEVNLDCLTDPGEMDLIKLLAFYPRLLAAAAAAKEPHRIAFYLYDLASCFHTLWNKGKDMPHLRFINSDNAGWTSAHLALLRGTEIVLASGLQILGVSAPREMR